MKPNFKVPVMEYGVTLTEIPGEISLYFGIGNCECHCKGCHSAYLWDTNLNTPMKDPEYIFEIVRKYQHDVTAILFMGGNRNGMDFPVFLEEVVRPVKENTGKDIGIYLGAWDALDISYAAQYCRWIKVGLWQKDKGGLDSPTTHQIFMEIQNYKFLKKGDM